ncbi:STAS-like domain-containing protein [Pseudomonas sp. 10B1]|uniref:STAS-like domain-containing protein n=1 Tax=Pseudomonas sp. 10B1 TaxID=3048573 RepID=UPI002B232F17|nr:STAS-like domain-containing protein [Pseudomonas sp. 10B1]MEB0308340.1 STAS-like domain-containing protein [Pseudomonas sp. 10B1]
MKMTKMIISKEFSEYPAGRYRADGAFSGEVFRDDLLIPKLTDFDVVEINLDGSMGYGSSFLEEAFGGLVRIRNFTKEILHKKLRFNYKEDPLVIEEIWHYIDTAHG